MAGFHTVACPLNCTLVPAVVSCCQLAAAHLYNLKSPACAQILDWILNRGSLLHPSLNLPQFIAVVALPITPAAGATASCQRCRSWVASCVG